MAIRKLGFAHWTSSCHKCHYSWETNYTGPEHKKLQNVDTLAKNIARNRLIRHYRNIHYTEWED